MSSYPSDWDSRRKSVYQRDGYQCQNCGSAGGSKGNTELHAHHIVPKAQGGTHKKSNLITVCKDCHNSIHGNKPAPTAKGVLGGSSDDKPLNSASRTHEKKNQQFSLFFAQEFRPALEEFSEKESPEAAENLAKSTYQYLSYTFELKKAVKNMKDATSEAHHNMPQEYINKTEEVCELQMDRLKSSIEFIENLYTESEELSRNTEICPECSSDINSSDSFCSECGAEIRDVGSELMSDEEIDVVKLGRILNTITEKTQKVTISNTERISILLDFNEEGNVGWDYCPNCGINIYIKEKNRTATCPVCEASWKKQRKGIISTKVVWEMRNGRNEGETKTKSEWNNLANERNDQGLYHYEWDEEAASRVNQELSRVTQELGY